MEASSEWITCNSETFWREIALGSHVLQLYKHEEALLNLLEGFIVGGISVGDGIIIIATKAHLETLAARLQEHELDIEALRAANQYIPLDAANVLAQFMENGQPNPVLFEQTIQQIFDSVRETRRPVRAFGEMVAMLWEEGNHAATLEVEHFWNNLFRKETFSLLCAYPQAIFAADAAIQLRHICCAHATMVTSSGNKKFDLAYQEIATDVDTVL